jgi:hypothetical protein
MKLFLIFAFVISLNTILADKIALAQGGPPMVTDDPITVEKGHWENNLGFTFEHNGDEYVFEVPHEDLNYGLSEHIQLKAEIPFIINHLENNENNGTVSGFGELNLGVKWKIIDSKKADVKAGIYPQFSLNITSISSDKGLTDEGVEFFLPLSIQKDFGKSAFVIELARIRCLKFIPAVCPTNSAW